MALSTTTVWEVRQAGSVNNGGGVNTATVVVDYSQQNSPQLTNTDGSAAGTTTFTSLGSTFTSNMVGNLLKIVSSTGLTVGWYEITAFTDANNVVLDRSPGTGTATTFNVGGAIAAIDNIGSATVGLGAVAGNLICVKADATYSRTTNSDTFAVNGTSTNPIRICGYNATRPTASTRPDSSIGTRTNGNGPLITTDMPSYTYTSGQLAASGNWVIIEGLNLSGAGNTILVDRLASNILTVNCRIAQASTGGGAYCLRYNSTDSVVLNCDLTLSNGGGDGLYAFWTNAPGEMIGCRIKSSAVGIFVLAGIWLIGNTIYECTTDGIQFGGSSAYGLIMNNTIVSCGGDGIDIISTVSLLSSIIGNCITDNGGYGIDLNGASVGANIGWNRTRDNASGAINSGTGWVNATNFSPVTTDTGGPSTDYVNSGADDYSLIAASPAVSVGLPLYASMGALQRSQTGGGTTTIVNAPKTQRNLPDIKVS